MKALVVTLNDGKRRTYPATTYTEYSGQVLMLKDKFSEPEWWYCFSLRHVLCWGVEEVEQ